MSSLSADRDTACTGAPCGTRVLVSPQPKWRRVAAHMAQSLAFIRQEMPPPGAQVAQLLFGSL